MNNKRVMVNLIKQFIEDERRRRRNGISATWMKSAESRTLKTAKHQVVSLNLKRSEAMKVGKRRADVCR